MSLEEVQNLRTQVAELFIVRASGHSLDNQRKFPQWELENKKLKRFLKEGVGGVILFGGSATELAYRCKSILEWAKKPLILCADIEEGLGQRFDGGTRFVPPMGLGQLYESEPTKAIKFAELYGRFTAVQARKCGLNLVLGPVCDINTNPENPVINIRSWGENPSCVSALANAFHKGVEKENVLSCAKHFPGHGDTNVDSHLDLPVLNQSIHHLENIELVPFKKVINEDISSIMTGHLLVKNIDELLPATLSKKVVSNLLRKQLKFNGLIITDALIMNAISKRYGSNEAVVLAFEAGVDLILMPENINEGITALCEAFKSGRIPIDRLKESLLRRKKALKSVINSKPEINLEEFINNNQSLESEEHKLFAKNLIKHTIQIKNSASLPITDNSVNLVSIDELMSSPIINQLSPALIIPSMLGFENIVCHNIGISPWCSNSLGKLDLERIHNKPTFLQIFARGNPFSGASNNFDPWLEAVKQLQREGLLTGLVLYGSPYLWKKLIEVINPSLPSAYSPGQMHEAQSQVLNSLMNPKGFKSHQKKEGRFTN